MGRTGFKGTVVVAGLENEFAFVSSNVGFGYAEVLVVVAVTVAAVSTEGIDEAFSDTVADTDKVSSVIAFCFDMICVTSEDVETNCVFNCSPFIDIGALISSSSSSLVLESFLSCDVCGGI